MKRSTLWCAAVLGCAACAPAEKETVPAGGSMPTAAAVDTSTAPLGAAADSGRIGGGTADLVQGDTVPGLPSWTRQDWEVLRRTLAVARANHLDGLPIGERIARVGETFVGSPYLPQTLDPPGAERLVINLRAMDCVTFVENMVALAHFVREAPPDVLDRPEDAMRLYQAMIERIRYRDGRLSGYPSRLHYFSEWLADNEKKGLLRVVTEELGGIADPEPISFMSGHRGSYRQLASDADYAEIGRIETRLSQATRYYVPKDRVATIAGEIRDGDILAMTSTLQGLDVAHTGIAVRRDGEVHLLNAPLVGKNVEISEKEISLRLAGIKSQDGLMVARPIDVRLVSK